MKVGAVTQQVQVTSAAPTVQLVSSTISDNVNSTTVRQLPLNGRSWTDLATLQPGITIIRNLPSVTTDVVDRLGRGLGPELTVSGSRPGQNNFLVDGLSINDYSNQGPGSLVGGNLGVDAVEQFTVLTTNYSAEYGRTSGGVVSAITRSGTNQFHGDVYEFLRNSNLDAANFFDNYGNLTKPPFRRNQFGASAGGPIQKDKTFIFGDYEGLRQQLGLSNFQQVPSLAARAGNLCNPPDCSTTTNVGVSPLVQPFLAFYPLPNGPAICPFASCVAGAGDTAPYNFSGSQPAVENYFTVRLDHTFSSADNLSGTYTYDNATSSFTDEFANKDVLSGTNRQFIVLEENHIFNPTLINSFRVGFNREFAGAPNGGKAINPLAASTALGFAPGETAGNISVPGLTFFSGGLSTLQPQTFSWNDWQAYDNVFLTKGIHSIKFGANIERIEDNQFGSSRPGGEFDFASLRDFLTDTPIDGPFVFTSDIPGTVTPRGIRESIVGAYVQDDMRLRPNLTVNAGLRYEMATVPTEVQGKLASLHSFTGTQIFTGSPLFANPSLKDFEPRIGFAWDPFHNGKTSIRGGFGVFDVQVLPVTLRQTLDGTLPFAFSANGASNLPAGSFPTGAFATLSATQQSERVAYIEQKPPRNYVFQWNFNIQRQIAPSATVMIAYVGSRGVHNILQIDDASIVMPTITPQGYTWPLPTGSGTVLNPNFGRMAPTLFDSSSIYHGLELEFTKKMSHGLQAQASFTWAKSIDTSSGTTDGDQFQNGISSLFFFSQKIRRGLSDYNVGRNLVLNYTWDIPTPSSFTGIERGVLGGWELGGIFTASDGTPFTPNLGGDVLGLNSTDPWDFPDRLTGSGCGSLVNPGNVNNYVKLQCFAFPNPTNVLGNGGRNIIIGPGLAEFDFSLFKNIPIKRVSESFNIQFRAETFNILNRANFGSPTSNQTLFDGSGAAVPGAGVLNATSTASRQIQFAIKVSW
ncbi:MAG: TonB-dependent receptor domain-containing protein [Terriglobia bacterium]